jgi:transposase
MAQPNRAADERHLAWLILRLSGMTQAEVAQRFGVDPRAVGLMENKIRRDDLRASCTEDPVAVSRWYPRPRVRSGRGRSK